MNFLITSEVDIPLSGVMHFKDSASWAFKIKFPTVSGNPHKQWLKDRYNQYECLITAVGARVEDVKIINILYWDKSGKEHEASVLPEIDDQGQMKPINLQTGKPYWETRLREMALQADDKK